MGGVSLPIFAVEMARAKMTPEALNLGLGQGKIYSPEGALGNAGFLDELVSEPNTVVELAVKRAQELADDIKQPAFHDIKKCTRAAALFTIKSTLEEDCEQYRV